MTHYGDPEGIFSSVRTAAAPAEVDAYRATPQFAVSLMKLATMSVCTFGLYQLYWAYKQWDAVRRREHEDLSPFWRAFFAPLWGFSLFPRIQRLTAGLGVTATWSGSALGAAYFLICATARLPDPLWFISVWAFIPLLVVQHAVNRLNAVAAPEAPRNDEFSGANIAGVIVGGILLLFAILGTLLPADQ